jgi:hypothetical protein
VALNRLVLSMFVALSRTVPQVTRYEQRVLQEMDPEAAAQLRQVRMTTASKTNQTLAPSSPSSHQPCI